MRLGLILPTFRLTPREALRAAAAADDLGLDGVFAYDHLWPMGSPERPALAPFETLATVAVRHPRVVVGTLVARVGLVADDVLVSQLRALRAVASGDVVCALGTGDAKSRDENLAYGVAYDPPETRRASLRAVAETLVADGAEVWVGGAAGPTRDLALAVGCTANLWDADPDEVRSAAGATPVTWAGPYPTDAAAPDRARARELVVALQSAGARWAVFGAPAGVEDVAALRDALRAS
jgi:Luciferase-like monooxygenase